MLSVNGVEVRRHQVRGPVGYTVVGSPTIVDGVMTNANQDNYVSTQQVFSANYTDYEMVFRCAKRIAGEEIVCCVGNGNNGNFQCRLLRNAFRVMPYTYAEYLEVPDSYTLGTWYWFKIRRVGNTICASSSNDGQVWGQEISKTFEQLTTLSANLSFGGRPNAGALWNGPAIDLNHTYIKVNGKLWFYQPQETKYIVKDGKLVWADPRLALSGPVNYTVVGSPTIVDGVASGFAAEKYVDYVSPITAGSSCELVIKIIAKDVSTQQRFVMFGSSSVLRLMTGQSSVRVSMYGFNADNTYRSPNGRTLLQIDQTYWIKVVGTSEGAIVYLSADGENYTQEFQTDILITRADLTYIRMGGGDSYYSRCPIDLKESYIKVNGQLWFYGKNYATSNIAPVPAGYTFGNTTTPSIGYVDMRTQQFTAAPDGAVIGREE